MYTEILLLEVRDDLNTTNEQVSNVMKYDDLTTYQFYLHRFSCSMYAELGAKYKRQEAKMVQVAVPIKVMLDGLNEMCYGFQYKDRNGSGAKINEIGRSYIDKCSNEVEVNAFISLVDGAHYSGFDKYTLLEAVAMAYLNTNGFEETRYIGGIHCQPKYFTHGFVAVH